MSLRSVGYIERPYLKNNQANKKITTKLQCTNEPKTYKPVRERKKMVFSLAFVFLIFFCKHLDFLKILFEFYVGFGFSFGGNQCIG
jgi:hypothetical protein